MIVTQLEVGDLVLVDSHTWKLITNGRCLTDMRGRPTNYQTGGYPLFVMQTQSPLLQPDRIVCGCIGEGIHPSRDQGFDPVAILPGVLDLDVASMSRKKFAWASVAVVVPTRALSRFPADDVPANLRGMGARWDAILNTRNACWLNRTGTCKDFAAAIDAYAGAGIQ